MKFHELASPWFASVSTATAVVFFLVALVVPNTTALPAVVQNRQLIVNGKPLHLKGVCWNPVRKAGVHPKDLDFEGFVAADAEIMAIAGINAVRTYEPIKHRRVLDILWEKGIHVLHTVYMHANDPVHVAAERVDAVKDHPAILMWVVGNEWNYNGLYAGLPYPAALERVKAVVTLVKAHDTQHPVATVYGEFPSTSTLKTLDMVDVWGINKYSGLDFGDLFSKWRSISNVPMFLGEYGADAYDSSHSRIDEDAQAQATTTLTEQIVKASSLNPGGVCIGGMIFEFADEWWKDGAGNPDSHDVGGISPGGGPFPDFTFNEEWWGLVEYDGSPRKAFWAYSRISIPGSGQREEDQHNLEKDGFLSARIRPRTRACGSHSACKHLIGFCCPDDNGRSHKCCSSKPAAETTEAPPKTSTTWVPPAYADNEYERLHHTCQDWVYNGSPGMFANGRFPVGSLGCHGVGECQFLNMRTARHFCDRQPRCSAVLLHPFEDNCAGGFGCYTPRFGSLSLNTLWQRSGGQAWSRGQSKCKGKTSTSPSLSHKKSSKSRFAFIGFHTAIEAQSACRDIGRTAMPKTSAELRELLAAVSAAQASNKLSEKWPKNTIWLGAQYNPTTQRWEWMDGAAFNWKNWAPGQPSAKNTNQMTEPWLSMLLNGEFHDSSPEFQFGVMCEIGKHLNHVLFKDATEHAGHAKQASELPFTPPPATISPSTISSIASGRSSSGKFEFVGFSWPDAARHACSPGMHLAMPKTDADWSELLVAVHSAKEAGKLSNVWPHNTVWLGGKWDVQTRAWRWDDGDLASGLRWAPGHPAGGDAEHAMDPWLCLVSEGLVYESKAPFSFGVMCTDSTIKNKRRELNLPMDVYA